MQPRSGKLHRFALGFAVVGLACVSCKAAENEKGVDPTAGVSSDRAGSGTAAGSAASIGTKPGSGSAAVGATAGKAIPDDLTNLAEMPELTAEATEDEINRRVDRVVDALSAFLEVIAEHEDCAKMGESLSRFVDLNSRFLNSLNEKISDPAISKRVFERLTARGSKWISKLGENLSRCAKDPTVMGALMRLETEKARGR